MKRMADAVAKQIRARGDDATEENRRMLDLLQNGGACVREEALDEIAAWFAAGPHEGIVQSTPTVEI